MNESKFKVGDRVRLNPETTQGLGYRDFRDKETVIINAWPHIDLYEISIGNKPISTGVKSNDLVMVESYDPTTAFLSELKGLLEKYNASIYVDFNQSDEIYTTTIAVGEDSVKYNYTDGIDCDNIMDYDKE